MLETTRPHRRPHWGRFTAAGYIIALMAGVVSGVNDIIMNKAQSRISNCLCLLVFNKTLSYNEYRLDYWRKDEIKTYRFHFNTEYAANLRNAVNDRPKQSLENVHNERQAKGPYCAWNRTCAAMDRLEDTLHYLNNLELGKDRRGRSAFDFYDFINNTYIVIDCIKTIGRIFRVKNQLIAEIEDSTEVFGTRLVEKSTDQTYFEYIRALCSVHPLCTNRQQAFLNGSSFHCCPFVIWRKPIFQYGDPNADLTAFIYPTGSGKTIFHGLYVSQFEQYLTKWIDFIPQIIEAKNTYTDNEYARLRQEPVKYLSDFNSDIIQYLTYLNSEYCKRFDYGCDYIFDDYISFFTINLSDSRNCTALEKYKNAIVYSLGFLRNELQNMSYESYENTGIKYPESWIETTLFDSLHSISPYDSEFSKYSYHLGKIYYLSSGSSYNEYDKTYARFLLEEPKELINRYVHFTNSEPDGERVILVQLALYLDALTRKNLLNKNIPNTPEYRIQVLSEEQYADLLAEEVVDHAQVEKNLEKFLEMVKDLGS